MVEWWKFEDEATESASASRAGKTEGPPPVPPWPAAGVYEESSVEETQVAPQARPAKRKVEAAPSKWDLGRPLQVLIWGLADQGKTAYLWAIGHTLPSSTVGEFSFGELRKDSRSGGRGFQNHWNALSERLENWQRTVSNFQDGDFESGHFTLFDVSSSRHAPAKLAIKSIDLPGEAVSDSEGHRGYGGQKDTKYRKRAAQIRKHADVCILMIRADKLESQGADQIRVERFLKDSIFSLVRTGRPVAIVLTAVDAIQDPDFREALLDASLSLEVRQEIVQEFLRVHVPDLVDRAVDKGLHAFFGVSAWGPDAVDTEDKYHIRNPRPLFVEEPLVWCIRKGWVERTGLWRARRHHRLLRLVTMPAALVGLIVGSANLSQGLEAQTAGIASGLAEQSAELLSKEGSLRDARIHRLFQSVMERARGGASPEVEAALEKLHRVPGGQRYASRAAMYAIQTTLVQLERREVAPEDVVAELDRFLESGSWMRWLDRYDQIQFKNLRLRAALDVDWLNLDGFDLAGELEADPLFSMEYGPGLVGAALGAGLRSCEDEAGFRKLAEACEAFFSSLPEDQRPMVEASVTPFLTDDTVADLSENPTRAHFRIRLLQVLEALGAASGIRDELTAGIQGKVRELVGQQKIEEAFQVLKRASVDDGLVSGLLGPWSLVYEAKVDARNLPDVQFLLGSLGDVPDPSGADSALGLAAADFRLARSWQTRRDSLQYLLEDHWAAYEAHWRNGREVSMADLKRLVGRHRLVLAAAQVPVDSTDSLQRRVLGFQRESLLAILRNRAGEADELLDYGLDLLLANEHGQARFTKDWVEVLADDPERFAPYPLSTWILAASAIDGVGDLTTGRLQRLAEGLSGRIARDREQSKGFLEGPEGLGLAVALVLLSTEKAEGEGAPDDLVVEWLRRNAGSFVRDCDPVQVALQLNDLGTQRPARFGRIMEKTPRRVVQAFAVGLWAAAQEAPDRDGMIALLAAAMSSQDPVVCRSIQEELLQPSISWWSASGDSLLGTLSRVEAILAIRRAREQCAVTLAAAVSRAASDGLSAARAAHGPFAVVHALEGIRDELNITDEGRWLTRASLAELNLARLQLAAEHAVSGDHRWARARLVAIASEEPADLGARFAQAILDQLDAHGSSGAFEAMEALVLSAASDTTGEVLQVHLDGAEYLLRRVPNDRSVPDHFSAVSFEGRVLSSVLDMFQQADRFLASGVVETLEGAVRSSVESMGDLDSLELAASDIRAFMGQVRAAAGSAQVEEEAASWWSELAWTRIRREPEDQRVRWARGLSLTGMPWQAAATQGLAYLCREGALEAAAELAAQLEDVELREEWLQVIQGLEGMVYISGGDFFMAQHEVTVEQYREFVQRQSRSRGGPPVADLRPGPTREEYMLDRVPVQKISWRTAEAYCAFFGWQLPTEKQYELAIFESGGWPALAASAQERNALTVVPFSQGLTGLLTNAPEYLRDTDGKAIGQYAVGDPRPLDLSTLTFDLPASRSDKRPYIGFRPVMAFPHHLVTEL